MFLKIIFFKNNTGPRIEPWGIPHKFDQPADKMNCSSRLEPGGARYLRAGLTKCKLVSNVNTLKSVSSEPSTRSFMYCSLH